jgi:hypothetical protein
MRSIRTDKMMPLMAGLLVLVVALCILPACLESACGMVMGNTSLADLLVCDSMYLPTDLPTATLVPLLLVAAFVIALPFMAAEPRLALVVGGDTVRPHIRRTADPPNDPLFGRLLI